MTFLERNVKVKDLVTDRHSMVKKYMRENHKDKNHYFDVWHVAKGRIMVTNRHSTCVIKFTRYLIKVSSCPCHQDICEAERLLY
jgi:uncharacterized protein (DUF427 family)